MAWASDRCPKPLMRLVLHVNEVRPVVLDVVPWIKKFLNKKCCGEREKQLHAEGLKFVNCMRKTTCGQLTNSCLKMHGKFAAWNFLCYFPFTFWRKIFALLIRFKKFSKSWLILQDQERQRKSKLSLFNPFPDLLRDQLLIFLHTCFSSVYRDFPLWLIHVITAAD